MGCRERARGALGIPGGRGAGVYSAGTAQALVNMKGYLPGKQAVILGSGDIGLIMARRLTLEGAKVLGVFEIMPYSGGLKRNIAQCLNDYDIPLYLSHTVTRTVGAQRLEGVYVAEVDEAWQPVLETERFIPCDTLLLSVGLIPENELSKKIGVSLSAGTSGPVVNNRLETSVPGVFACGNVLHVHDLVDYVTLEAYKAARYAVEYIANSMINSPEVAAPENAKQAFSGDFAAIGGTDFELIRYICGNNENTPHGYIPITPGSGVRYTVPMEIIPEGPEAVYAVSFRSDKVYEPGVVKILADGVEIRSISKRIIVPSEMERVRFALKKPAGEIKLEVL